ncbi:MAG TPA: dephospho-CoA kinase [Usitatibacteraceae bacterium]
MPGIWDAAQLDGSPMDINQLLTVGLTGGIGSGKSTVASILGELGAAVIDADLIAHQLTVPDGGAMDEIRLAFGEKFVDARGALNRQLMREKAFGDPSIKARLESILHPRIRVEISRALAAVATEKGIQPTGVGHAERAPVYAVLVLPLLFETNAYTRLLSRVLVVDCPESRQIRQVVHRSAIAVDEVRRIMAAQIPRALRLQLADDILCNTSTTETLQEAAHGLHTHYCALARRRVEGGMAV